MARFVFKLQRVLDLRAQEEEVKKNELALAERAWREEVARLEALRQRRAATMTALLAPELRGDVAALLDGQRYLAVLAEDTARQQQQVAQARAAADAKRGELVVASQKKRVLEKLRDKRRAEWRQAEERAEQRFLDEMNLADDGWDRAAKETAAAATAEAGAVWRQETA